MTSGPNIPDGQRKRPKLTGVTTSEETAEELKKHLVRTGESKSRLVEAAIREKLGLPPEQKEER